MSEVWRLLVTEPADGATNMAIDEALWRGRQAGTSPPTLRFFGWAPPTVSLGYGQALNTDIDISACRALGVGLVRRPTGGSAIYHDGPERELTYSVSAATEDLQTASDLLETYRWIGNALLRGLNTLGVGAELVPVAAADGPLPAFCFARTGRYEIEIGGRKVVGSAQRRQGACFLQHGSILLGADVRRLRAVFPTTPDPLERMTTRDRPRPPSALVRGGRAACRRLRARAWSHLQAGRPHPRGARAGGGTGSYPVHVRCLAGRGDVTREYPSCPRVGVGAIVLHEGRVLLVQRGRPPAFGKWSLPGGLVDLGETTSAAVRREVVEECGIEVRLAGVAGVVDRITRDETGRVRYHYVLIDYLAYADSDTVTAGSDAADVKWVPAEHVHTLDVTEGLVDMIERALALAREEES